MKKQAVLRKVKLTNFAEFKTKILSPVTTDINLSRYDQLVGENAMWEKSLSFLKQENASLKTRLSVVTDSNNGREFIKLAEYFQNQFLLKDEFIKGLKVEISAHLADLTNGDNRTITGDIEKKQEQLRKRVSYFETDFSRLKNEFNQLSTQFL